MNRKLRNAILEQVGVSLAEFKENASDYRNASAGISGFIYYTDTHQFAMDNQTEIIELLEDSAEQIGEDVVEMVSNFNVFRGNMDKEDKKDLYRYLGESKDIEQGALTNIMAWFAVEQLAWEFDN